MAENKTKANVSNIPYPGFLISLRQKQKQCVHSPPLYNRKSEQAKPVGNLTPVAVVIRKLEDGLSYCMYR